MEGGQAVEDVTVRNLGKSFDGKPVFSNLDMTFVNGEVTAVLGPSGRGKTTLIRVLCGLERQDVGDVAMPEGIGCSVVFQEPRLLPWLTVEGNLRYCMDGEGAGRALEILSGLGLDGFKDRYPASLSGGEQQMLAMCRALASKPKLLMIDEPSMGLAPILVREIFDTVALINKRGVTILIVEQNANMALSLANRAFVLEVGKIVLEGSAAELSCDEKVREAYLGGK